MGLLDGKKTPAEWKALLVSEALPVTLDEYVAGSIIRMLGALIQISEATLHIEGMLGAMDDTCARNDPDYAGSALVREALWKQRRALAALAENPEAAAVAAQVRDALAPGLRRSLDLPEPDPRR
jgi:hypothetical protein